MTAKEVEELIKLAKKHKVKQLTLDGCTVTLGDTQVNPRSKKKETTIHTKKDARVERDGTPSWMPPDPDVSRLRNVPERVIDPVLDDPDLWSALDETTN